MTDKPTKSMIERVTQAISDNTYALDDGVVEGADDAARAVLKAMREPSLGILLASWNQTKNISPEQRMAATLGSTRDAHLAKMRQRWQAMIDKALEDG